MEQTSTKDSSVPSSATCWTTNRNPFYISLVMFGLSAYLGVYMMFYMKVFLDVYHISTDYVRIVQALFLVWNAVNDPLMGYVQDIGCCGIAWIMDRRKVILYCGPAFACSFLIFWFPWSTTNTVIVGIHFFVALFIWDTLLTLVLSAYCGLMVELSDSHKQRVRTLVFGELAGLLGGFLIITPVTYFSDGLHNFRAFQIGCVIAAIAGTIFTTTGAYHLRSTKTLHDEIELEKDDESPVKPEEDKWKGVRVSWQIIRSPRFICLVGGEFFRILRTGGMDAFLMIIIEALISSSTFMPPGSALYSAYLGTAKIFGVVAFLLLGPLVAAIGTHRMMFIMSALSLVNVIYGFIIGRFDPLMLLIFITIELTVSGCGRHSYYMLIAGEVADTDVQRHKRTSAMTTLIFTLKALFTKPAEQLGPMIMITFFEFGGYTKWKNTCLPQSIDTTTPSTLNDIEEMNNTTSTTSLLKMIEFDDNRNSLPQCAKLMDSIYYSIIVFAVTCIICEAIFLVIDYAYKLMLIRNIKRQEKERIFNRE